MAKEVSKKDVFDESLEDILEFDQELDVNSMLDAIPTIDKDDPVIEEPEDTEDKNKVKEPEKKEPKLKDVNKVLEKEVKKPEDKKVDEEIDTDDKAPANLETQHDETSDAPFTVIFARDLVKQGLLSSFDEDKFLEDSKTLGDAEALRSLIRNEIDTNLEAAKSDLDAGYQEYLRLMTGGVPQETAGSLIELKTRFDKINVADLEKEDNTDLRKQILTDYFKLTTSMSDKKIEKLVQTSVDLGEDIDDAKEYLNNLKGLVKEQITAEEEQAKEQTRLQEEEDRRRIEILKDDINATGEIIAGVAINKQTKNQMFEAITKPVQDSKGRTTNAIWAKRAEDPMFFDERLAYLYATGFFEKGKPWNKVAQVKTTKEISDLEKALAKQKNTTGTIGTPVLRSPEQEKTIKDNIDSMRGIFS
jgi:hypothetical protein